VPRLFLAVDLPDARREELARLQAGLSGARWVAAAQIHVTLRFLGHLKDEQVPPLVAALGEVRAPAFRLALAGIGTFPPGRSRARVLWAGLAPREPLAALKIAMDAAVDAVLGPDPEAGRGFSPHVTIARFRERPGPELPAYLAAHGALASEPWPVGAFHLYESHLSPKGARYVVRQSFPLVAA
jgi:2'-5' RNA ligase